MSQSQQTQVTDIQEEEIRLSINLPYVEDTSGKLRRILRSHKISSTFYSESTCKSNCKPDCKPKDRLAKEYKNIIVYKINCSNSEAIYFGVSKRSLKLRSDELKRSVENCNWEKRETSKHCWEQITTLTWTLTIHSLKNPIHINKISWMLPKYGFLISVSS